MTDEQINDDVDPGETTEETAPTRSALDVSPKVSGAALAGALATVVVFALSRFGIEVPGGVETAGVVLLSAVVGYLVPDRG